MPSYWQRTQSSRLSLSLSPLRTAYNNIHVYAHWQTSTATLQHICVYVCVCVVQAQVRYPYWKRTKFLKIFPDFDLWHAVYALHIRVLSRFDYAQSGYSKCNGNMEFFTYAQNTLPISIWHCVCVCVCVLTGLCACMMWYPYTHVHSMSYMEDQGILVFYLEAIFIIIFFFCSAKKSYF